MQLQYFVSSLEQTPMCSDDVLQEGGDMDPRDHKGDEGVTEAADDGMAGKHGSM